MKHNKRISKMRIMPKQYGSSENEQSPDIEQYPMIDNYDRYPEMKKGGVVPLYKMAGGGPLFINSDVVKLDTSGLKAKEEKGSQSSSGAEKMPSFNWRLGDDRKAEEKMNAYYSILADKAQNVYGGNIKAAMNDPYVKELERAATPNAAEIATKDRLRVIKDKQDAYINDTNDKKGSSLHLAAMRQNAAETGVFKPMLVQDTFNEFEMTPMEDLGNSVGKSWVNSNQVIGTGTYLDKRLRDRFNEAKGKIEQTRGLYGDDQLPEFKIDALGSLFTDEAVQGVVKTQLKTSSNAKALNTVIQNMVLDPTEEDEIEQRWIRNKANENAAAGKDVIWEDIYDDKGQVKQDYKEFRGNQITNKFDEYLETNFDPSVDWSATNWYETDGSGGTKPKPRLYGPYENIVFNRGESAKTINVNLTVPHVDPTKAKGNPERIVNEKKAFSTIVYPITNEIKTGMVDPAIGKRVSDFNVTGQALTNGGKPITFGSDLDLGVINSISGFVRLPSMDVAGDNVPYIHIDGSQKNLADGNHKMKTYMIATVAVTEDDIEKNQYSWKEYLQSGVDANGNSKVDEVPIYKPLAKKYFGNKYTSDSAWDSYWNDAIRTAGIKDLDNGVFGSTKPSGLDKSYADTYDGMNVPFTYGVRKGVVQMQVYIEVPSSWALEEMKKGSLTGSDAAKVDFQNSNIKINQK